MKLFGTVFPFIEKDEDSLKEGRYVANSDFVRALLTYSTFDEFHFFCLSRNFLEVTRKRVEKMDIPADRFARVRFFSITLLPHKLQECDYHVFHQGGWGYFLASLSYLRLRHSTVPFPITGITHSLNGMDTPAEALRLCSAPLLSCDTVICTSEGARLVMEKTVAAVCTRFSGSSVPVTYNGSLKVIPLATGITGSPEVDRIDARISLKLTPDAFIILSVGRFSAERKMDLYPLLSVVKKLRENNPRRNIRLVLAGGDEQRQAEKTRALAREMGLEREVVLFSRFDDTAKLLLYRASDLFVSPSDNLQETFGLAVIEAMMCGLPCVISDFDGYRDLLEDTVTGFLIPTRWVDSLPVADMADVMNFDTMQLMLAQGLSVDTEALRSRIQLLIDNPQECKAIGKRAAAAAAERFTWKSVMAQYEELWDAGKRTALQMAWQNESGRVNPFVHQYLDTFSHYPVTCIQPHSSITITADGRECLSAGRVPAMWGDIEPLVPPTLIIAILERLHRQGTSTLNEVAGSIVNVPEGSTLAYVVQWMTKYGLVTVT